jgi:hypothetical protein
MYQSHIDATDVAEEKSEFRMNEAIKIVFFFVDTINHFENLKIEIFGFIYFL